MPDTLAKRVRVEDLIGPAAEPFDMPGGSEPILLSRLHVEPDRAFSVCVMFPPGWQRPVTGHYAADEDVVLLTGDLRIGSSTLAPLDWCYMPEGFERATMGSEQGAVALARFGGPARWTEGAGSAEGLLHRHLKEVSPLTQTPFGLGSLLRRAPGHSTYLVTAPSANSAVSPMESQVLDLEEMSWHLVPEGSPIPELSGLALVWAAEA